MTDTDKAQALLDRLRALAQAAPHRGRRWEVSEREGRYGWIRVDLADLGEPVNRVQVGDGIRISGDERALAAYIAAANPAVVLALVEVLETAREVLGTSHTTEGVDEPLALAFDALEPEGGA